MKLSLAEPLGIHEYVIPRCLANVMVLGMAFFLLTFCQSPAIAADTETKAKPKQLVERTEWKAMSHWEAEGRQAVLVVSVTNRAKEPRRIGPWRVEGADAGEFTLDKKEAGQVVSVPPGKAATLRVRWELNRSRNKKLDATLCFEIQRDKKPEKSDKDKTAAPSGKIAPGKIALDAPIARVPFKFVAEGYFDRAEQSVPRDEHGRLRTDDGYHDDAMVARLVEAFAHDYPDIATVHEIGTTWQGRKIVALEISSNKKKPGEKPAIALLGAHHGNELISTELVLDAIEQLAGRYKTDPEVRHWVDDCRIWCVPLVNPDGTHQFFHRGGSGRKNGRDTNKNGQVDPTDGVDLNRNYPFRWHTLGEKGSSSKITHGRYRGPSPGSEPETKAVMRLADRERFIMLLSYHTSGSKVLVPYTIDGARNPHPDAAWIVGATMAALSDTARPDRDYQPARNLYAVDGTDQDWHYWRHGTLAYIWEGSRTNPPFARDRGPVVAGARPGWQYLLRRLSSGPTLSGHVHDAATGNPLEATVWIEEIQTFEGENHTSHPTTGRFDRVLPIEGTYHLRVKKQGYRSARVKVDLGHEWKTVDVALVPEKKPAVQAKDREEK
ncbi:MAG: hypothetical protein JW818_22660 [Pirellulales bacterium]|nr:hypothetical protein [Pirellulales bacterium]